MIHLVVTSGLCNRLFAIVSALRYARHTQQLLTIYWKIPVARAGVPYHGSYAHEHLNFFFQKMPNVTLKTWVRNLNDILIKDGNTLIYDGSQIIPEFMPKDKIGKIIYPSNFLELIKKPLLIPVAKNVIINMPTHPFGFLNDQMELYRNYPTEVGSAKVKTQYELELSKFARKFIPISFIQNHLDNLLEKLNQPQKNKVGIHIRRTDLKTDVTLQKLFKVIHRYISLYKETSIFYLCSDDFDIQQQFITKYNKKINIVSYTDKHKTVNNLNGVQKSTVDLFALANCNHILGTKGSSFSYFSWMLAHDNTTFEIHS